MGIFGFLRGRKTNGKFVDKEGRQVTVEVYVEDGIKTTAYSYKHRPDNDHDRSIALEAIVRTESEVRRRMKIIKSTSRELSTRSVVRRLFPKNTAHSCPYCAVIHEFEAKRARKCPDCGNAMRVRGGVFISDKQLARMDGWIAENSTLQNAQWQLKDARDRLEDNNYAGALVSVCFVMDRLGMAEESWRILANYGDLETLRDDDVMEFERGRYDHMLMLARGDATKAHGSIVSLFLWLSRYLTSDDYAEYVVSGAIRDLAKLLRDVADSNIERSISISRDKCLKLKYSRRAVAKVESMLRSEIHRMRY